MSDAFELTESTSFEALLSAGMTANERGNAAVALDCFAKAAELAPADPRPFHLAAATWAQSGQFDAANDAFREALIRDPALDVARFQWGLMQYGQQTMETAASIWRPLLSLPEGAPLRLFVEGLLAVADGDIPGAIGRLEDGMTANTGNPPLNADMGKIVEGLRPLMPVEDATRAGNETDSEAQTDEHFLLGAYRSPDQPLH
ncbi:tetratricopeptide repeat protein [Pandoraea bronchicola]|uniref:Uncharacterized protein n=1 Tax=Pandoraea bronchicola TaxID=2508287 RepID=A0A5E5BYZ4_9BURK|nr:hypothetical protein [Pandoraea bronchicola]VVE90708.1 hypothetical protein PBR20603_04695 [Pandoraea bronchicola]